MSFKDKEKDKRIEMDNKIEKNDDIDIKSHLNDSLDFNKITVSEDLINRTLNAIKGQTANDLDTDHREKIELDKIKMNKVVTWNSYIRKFAGAAAAVLVIFAGFSMMRLIGVGSKNSASTNQINYDTASKEIKSDRSNKDAKLDRSEAASDASAEASTDSNVENKSTNITKDETMKSYESTEQSPSDKENNTTFGVTAKKSVEEADKKTSNKSSSTTSDIKTTVAPKASKDNGSKKAKVDSNTSDDQSKKKVGAAPRSITAPKLDSGDEAERAPISNAKIAASTTPLDFKDICPMVPAETGYIRITELASKTTICLTDQVGILDFNTRMEKYKFTADSVVSDVDTYSIEICNPTASPSMYTITVGESLTIRYTSGDQEIKNTYTIQDMVSFMNEVSEFFKKYRN